MTIHLQTADGVKTFFPRGIMTPAGAKALAKITVKTPTGDKVVFDKATVISGGGGMSASADRPSVSGANAVDATIAISTAACTVTPSGGTAPYSYAWTLVSDDTAGAFGTWSATSPTTAITQFRASAVPPGIGLGTATFRCTVTDARGATATADVIAVLQNYGSI